MWLQEGVVGQEGGPGVPGPGRGKKVEEMDHLVLIKNKNEAGVECQRGRVKTVFPEEQLFDLSFCE
jgi:hypothetical protein